MVSPGSAAFIAFWMDSPGPTTELCAPVEPIAAASATPLATNRVRAIVATNNIARFVICPSSFAYPNVGKRWMRQTGVGRRIPTTQAPFLPFGLLVGDLDARVSRLHHNASPSIGSTAKI